MSFSVEIDLKENAIIKVEKRGWPWNRWRRVTFQEIETGVQHVIDTRHGVEIEVIQEKGS